MWINRGWEPRELAVYGNCTREKHHDMLFSFVSHLETLVFLCANTHRLTLHQHRDDTVVRLFHLTADALQKLNSK